MDLRLFFGGRPDTPRPRSSLSTPPKKTPTTTTTTTGRRLPPPHQGLHDPGGRLHARRRNRVPLHLRQPLSGRGFPCAAHRARDLVDGQQWQGRKWLPVLVECGRVCSRLPSPSSPRRRADEGAAPFSLVSRSFLTHAPSLSTPTTPCHPKKTHPTPPTQHHVRPLRLARRQARRLWARAGRRAARRPLFVAQDGARGDRATEPPSYSRDDRRVRGDVREMEWVE